MDTQIKREPARASAGRRKFQFSPTLQSMTRQCELTFRLVA